MCLLAVSCVWGSKHSVLIFLPQNASSVILSYVLVWRNQFSSFQQQNCVTWLLMGEKIVHFSFCSLIFLRSQESCLLLLRGRMCLSNGKPSQLLKSCETLRDCFKTYKPILFIKWSSGMLFLFSTCNGSKNWWQSYVDAVVISLPSFCAPKRSYSVVSVAGCAFFLANLGTRWSCLRATAHTVLSSGGQG